MGPGGMDDTIDFFDHVYLNFGMPETIKVILDNFLIVSEKFHKFHNFYCVFIFNYFGYSIKSIGFSNLLLISPRNGILLISVN